MRAMASSPTRLQPPTSPARPVTRPAAGRTFRWPRRFNDRRTTLAAAVATAALSGVLAAALLPRGPTTPVEALALLTVLLLAGAATGLLLRSRWAVLLAPALHLAGFELARATVVHVQGVAFGPVRLGTTAGVFLFVVGHGFYALVTALPLMLGAVGGAAVDSWNSLRGLADMFSIVYPQLQDIDFRRSATRLDLPVYVLEGRHELSARRLPAVDWFDRLQAPSKRLIWFERSGHNPQFEEATRYTDLMTGTVLEETYPAAG